MRNKIFSLYVYSPLKISIQVKFSCNLFLASTCQLQLSKHENQAKGKGGLPGNHCNIACGKGRQGAGGKEGDLEKIIVVKYNLIFFNTNIFKPIWKPTNCVHPRDGHAPYFYMRRSCLIDFSRQSMWRKLSDHRTWTLFKPQPRSSQCFSSAHPFSFGHRLKLANTLHTTKTMLIISLCIIS